MINFKIGSGWWMGVVAIIALVALFYCSEVIEVPAEINLSIH